MMIFGKLIGGSLGFLVGGLVGAIIGIVAGHYFDKGLAANLQAMSPEVLQKTQRVFFVTTFTMLGRLAKADGRVSEEEIEQTELLMSQMGLSSEHRKEAIELFKKGASNEADVDEMFAQFLQYCAVHSNLKQMLLVYLISLALADGELHSGEALILREVGESLGFNRRALDELLSRVKAQQHFAGHGAGASSEDELAFAYKALGVKPGDNDKVIKKAYRRLMSEHHPDKLIAEGMPDDMVKLATEKSQEIQSAFELIKKHRKRAH